MGFILVMAIVLSVMSRESSFVVGDIGTAASYAPPYLREYYCVINLVFLV